MKSRRDFLKIAGLSVFALGTASALTLTIGSKASAPSAGTASTKGSYTNEPDALHAKHWAMVIGTRKFTLLEHFQRVTDVCHHAHNVPTISGNQDVKWVWTDKYAHVFPDNANVYMPEKFLHSDFLLLCNHCENPPCVRVYPTAATFGRKDGIVVMDPHHCIGCHFCMAGCPFGARNFNFRDPQPYAKDMNPEFPMRTRGVVEKCTFCAERLARGKLPACVEASEGTMILGDLNDPGSPVCQALSESFTIRHKPTLDTQPGVHCIIQEAAMLELILKGRPRFYLWLCFLDAIFSLGFIVHIFQANIGPAITGMSRDVSWGLYIAQFTYFVGVAAGAVMLVLPAYFHHYKKFKRIIIFGEFMAVGAVIMCTFFIVVDLRQPQRVLNVLSHPTPNSMTFWDMTVLFSYLFLNIIIGWVTLEAVRNDVKPPKWIRVLIYIPIIWAFSIHAITGFLYTGIPGRHYWLTAIMAARFLTSVFCSGPAILLLLLIAVRRVTGFEPGREAMKTLSTIITYAMCVNVFFYLLEVFTAFYSGIPGHQHFILHLFTGHNGHMAWINSRMWTAVVFAVLSLLMLIPSTLRYNDKILPWALILLVIASWIDKSLGLFIGGFVPNMFETVTEYTLTIPEILVVLGVYGLGGIIISVLWEIAMDVKKENGTFALKDN